MIIKINSTKTRVAYIVLCSKKKTEKIKTDEKYSQTGITVQIHTNHDSVRMTAIMLRSITTSSSSQSLVITVKIASEITSFPMH